MNTLVPYQPVASASLQQVGGTTAGATPLANADADARLWPELLAFLASSGGRSGTFTAPATPPPLGPAPTR